MHNRNTKQEQPEKRQPGSMSSYNNREENRPGSVEEVKENEMEGNAGENNNVKSSENLASKPKDQEQ